MLKWLTRALAIGLCAPALLWPEIPAGSLYLHLPFDGSYSDASGRNKTGLPSGTPVFTDDRSGAAHGALLLDGADDFVTCKNSGDFDCTVNYSVSLWFKADSADKPQPMCLVSKNGLDGRDDCRAQFNLEILGSDSGRLHYFMGDNTMGHGHAVSIFGGKMISHVWTHAAVTMTGDTARLYVNGAPVDSAVFMSSGRVMAFENVQVGRYSNDNLAIPVQLFQGAIDEVRLYARALTGAEVAALSRDFPVLSENPVLEVGRAADFSLSISPNPFHSSSVVRLSGALGQKAQMAVFSLDGRMIRGFKTDLTGTGHFVWDGFDGMNKPAVSGAYLVKVRLQDGRQATKRLILTR